MKDTKRKWMMTTNDDNDDDDDDGDQMVMMLADDADDNHNDDDNNDHDDDDSVESKTVIPEIESSFGGRPRILFLGFLRLLRLLRILCLQALLRRLLLHFSLWLPLLWFGRADINSLVGSRHLKVCVR